MLYEMLETLTNIPDKVWDVYALRHEPLLGKLTSPLRAQLLELAHNTGVQLAEETAREHPGMRPGEILKALGVNVVLKPDSDEGARMMFACYEEPNTVTVWMRTVEQAKETLSRENALPLLEGVQLQDILLAHELYHYYEYTRKDLPTSQKLLTLWKIGSFSYKSKVVTLDEVGAMVFAKELLHLSYSPYLMDVLLLYPGNQRLSKQLYDYIVSLHTQSLGQQHGQGEKPC